MHLSLEGRAEPVGYRMIDELNVRNFRCFESLELRKLRRINLVVGRNSVGKTALLEALRLAVGASPQIAAWLNQVRGFGQFFVQPNMSREQFEGLWNHFFFRLENDRRIVIERRDSKQFVSSVEIFFDPSQAVTQIPEMGKVQGAEAVALQRIIPPTAIVPLVFRRSSLTINSDLKATVLPGGQIHLEPGPELGPATAVMGAIVGYTPQDSSAWLTEIVKRNRESEILELVKREYPEVQGLAVVPGMPYSSIWVSVPYLKEKIPLTLLSGGINKFVSIILAAFFYKNGLLLIDEIENGTYYDRMPSLWTTLHRVAKDTDCQIFATTHSQECLEAALEIIRADEDQFSLIRVRRTDGQSTVRQFTGRDVASAIEEGIEVR